MTTPDATTIRTNPTIVASPTLWLILINVGVWLFLGLRGVSWTSPTPDELTAWGGNLGPYTVTGEWHRLLSSMFLHGGAIHLALNMFLLSQIGPLSEAVWGRTRFLLIYLVSGLFGSLASAWWYTLVALRGLEPSELQLAFNVAPTIVTTVGVGASGALLGASGALLMRAMNKPEEALIDLKVAAQVVALNIGMGFFIDGVDNAAHVGGAVAGLVIAALLLMPGERLRINGVLQSAAVFAASLLVLGVLAMRPASDEVREIASAIRGAAAEEARIAAQQAKRERAEEIGKIERAALPAAASREAAAGTSTPIAGNVDGLPFPPRPDFWYALDASTNRLARFNLATLQLDRQWPGPALAVDEESGCMDNTCRGVGVAGAAASRDGTWAMVSSMVADSVSRIDLRSGEVPWSVKVGRYPRVMFLSDNQNYAFTVHGPENILSVIDIGQRKLLSTMPVGRPTEGFPFGRYIGAAQGKGILYLADSEDNAIYAIDTEAPAKLDKIIGTGELSPYQLALSADGSKLFVSGPGGMQIVDTRTRERSDELFSCSNDSPPPIAVNRDGSWIAINLPYEKQIRIISIASQRVVRVLPTSGGDRTMGFAPDGKSLYALGALDTQEPRSVLTRYDLSRTLDVAAALEEHGEYFCTPKEEAAPVLPSELYRALRNFQ
ncbi:rhomboid family intramembrane serine protease [Massilia oculi]|uniref:rhomboid family intramembrane serine protease n=1 Tax=Massilia oculi TaxID=945844 RepID=UPI0028AC6A23|nr:rhomboid family intramembrane serine protease [Massilia oculi]